MYDPKRPTAKDILDGILRALHDAQEPFDEGLVLVPAVFYVRLHPDAYLDLKPLMPRIREQAMVRLDAELERLNASGGTSWLRRLLAPLRRFFSAEAYLSSGIPSAATVERAAEAWSVDFGVSAEEGAGLDHLAVETDFGLKAQQSYRGRPTVNIRRTTRRLPDGRFETVLMADRPEAGGPASPELAGRPTSARNVLARLSYEDLSGRHTFYMQKAQIIIGRKDDPAHYLDIALQTLPDVSREHVRIRHADADFWIKDVSQYGVTVDGEAIPTSMNAAGEDTNEWHPLPRRAIIGLADVVHVDFEAL